MDSIEAAVGQWLNSVVIGLNLCPFSHRPARENRVRLQVSSATSEEFLLQDLENEMLLLDSRPPAEIETTLLIVPNMLQDFFAYTQFLVWAESLIKRNGWKGIYQLASFHPDYCFAGAAQEDVENLTNRSPYPILHIIREASLAAALNHVADVEGIPERNKQTMRELSAEQQRQLFPYVFNIEGKS
ncbi:MAG TPA: DUF1415 domain-containing protein [Cellvibrio sp.]|nr:DUF1415 domain-containing protein [Cellvibrio sp.]